MATELTEQELQTYFDGEARRLALGREVSRLEAKLKPVKAKISDYIDEKGGADRTTVHCGFVLAKTPGLGQPKYMEAFLAIATPEDLKNLEATRKPIEKIEVTKAAQ